MTNERRTAPQGAVAPTSHHPLAARLIADFDLASRGRTVVGIAGESGSGKSVTATTLARELTVAGLRTEVIHQDDYFHLPPRTNHERRVEDLGRVGPQEVNLDLLASHVADFRAGRDNVAAPAVDHPGNRFLSRRFDFAAAAVLVVEGTYVLHLHDLDVGVFLEATHEDTRERRRLRNRDIVAPVIDEILAIEHEIIVRQAAFANVAIDRDFAVRRRL